MKPFFIVGPTASGKSEIAAEVAARCGAEVVGADAFQIYRELSRLTAQPDASTLSRVPHHLVAALPPTEEMSAARFRDLATAAIDEIHGRGKPAIVAGGSGLYVRALTDGLSPLPATDLKLRDTLDQFSLKELNLRLRLLDAKTASTVDQNNKRRVLRAVEICLLTGKPVSEQRSLPKPTAANGIFVFRDRDDLYRRINLRVEQMFADGVVEEVRALGALSRTAEQTLGLREIRQVLVGKLTEAECISAIQQQTRRYAKRQLTWFRRQSSFEPLNLSDRTAAAAIEWITRQARLSFAHD